MRTCAEQGRPALCRTPLSGTRDLKFIRLFPLASYGRKVVAVELADDVLRDLLGAGRGALAGIGAAAEAQFVVGLQHVEHPGVALRLALRQEAQMGDLRAEEQRRGAVRAGRDAGA